MDMPSRYGEFSEQPDKEVPYYALFVGSMILGGLGGALLGAVSEGSIVEEAYIGAATTNTFYCAALCIRELPQFVRNVLKSRN